LRCEGERIHVEKQPFELLMLLIESRDQLVTHKDIVARLWGSGVYVESEQSVHSAICKIRKALHDDALAPRFIETVAGKGYRFIAPINVIPSSDKPSPANAVPSATKRWRRSSAAQAIAASLVLTVTAAILIYRYSEPRSQVSSVAILPLENLSGSADQQFLADAITDQLTTDLARVEGMSVTSRTTAMQYKGVHRPLRTIARELHVDAVVEGSVVRSARTIRITAQLIHGRTDRHLWAGSFEGPASDVLGVEQQVAQSISDHVQSRLTTASAASRRRPFKPDAYDSYLRGKYFFDKRTPESLGKSVGYFRDAIAKDPAFAPAYAGLAEALPDRNLWSGESVPAVLAEATAAAKRAVNLDDSLGDAHSALGSVLLLVWQWDAAEKELRRAVELNQSSAIAHQQLSMWLMSMARMPEALHEARQAQQLEPLSFFMNRHFGMVLMFAHRYDEALAQFRRASELEPNSSASSRCMSMIYELQGKTQDAIAMNLKELTEQGTPIETLSALRKAYAKDGWRGYWMERREQLISGKHATAYGRALIEARLGNADAALEWMERSAEQREQWVMWIRVDPLFDRLRNHAGYDRVLRKMNLPSS
jgi:TolB-like protein/DNA-binding winged helix-turn-helix (wHTH) protein/tetratricopeptide (TPR) repeat protein